MDPKLHSWVSSKLQGGAHLFLAIPLFLERRMWWNTFSTQLGTSSLFLGIFIVMLLYLRLICFRSEFKGKGVVKSPLYKWPHSALSFSDLQEPFTPWLLVDWFHWLLPHRLLSPIFLLKIYYWAWIFRNTCQLFFSLLMFSICICSATYSILLLLFPHLDTFFLNFTDGHRGVFLYSLKVFLVFFFMARTPHSPRLWAYMLSQHFHFLNAFPSVLFLLMSCSLLLPFRKQSSLSFMSFHLFCIQSESLFTGGSFTAASYTAPVCIQEGPKF